MIVFISNIYNNDIFLKWRAIKNNYYGTLINLFFVIKFL